MIHECDRKTRGGCEFDAILLATPSDLVDRGLYNALASPWFSGSQHRMIATKLTLKEIGAREVRRLSSLMRMDKS